MKRFISTFLIGMFILGTTAIASAYVSCPNCGEAINKGENHSCCSALGHDWTSKSNYDGSHEYYHKYNGDQNCTVTVSSVYTWKECSRCGQKTGNSYSKTENHSSCGR